MSHNGPSIKGDTMPTLIAVVCILAFIGLVAYAYIWDAHHPDN